MFPLPAEIITLFANFAACFDKRVWDHAVILVIGAILTPGKRTVTAVLRIMGRPRKLRTRCRSHVGLSLRSCAP